MTVSHASIGISTTGTRSRPRAAPALLITKSTRPNSSSASVQQRAHRPPRLRHRRRARWPSRRPARISSATESDVAPAGSFSSSGSGLGRPAGAGDDHLEPAFAISTAIGRPMLRMRPPPVTMATLPSRPVSSSAVIGEELQCLGLGRREVSKGWRPRQRRSPGFARGVARMANTPSTTTVMAGAGEARRALPLADNVGEEADRKRRDRVHAERHHRHGHHTARDKQARSVSSGSRCSTSGSRSKRRR